MELDRQLEEELRAEELMKHRQEPEKDCLVRQDERSQKHSSSQTHPSLLHPLSRREAETHTHARTCTDKHTHSTHIHIHTQTQICIQPHTHTRTHTQKSSECFQTTFVICGMDECVIHNSSLIALWRHKMCSLGNCGVVVERQHCSLGGE